MFKKKKSLSNEERDGKKCKESDVETSSNRTYSKQHENQKVPITTTNISDNKSN